MTVLHDTKVSAWSAGVPADHGTRQIHEDAKDLEKARRLDDERMGGVKK